MNKYYTAALVALFGLYSCSKSVQNDDSDSRMIRFQANIEADADLDAQINRGTRAGFVGTDFANGDILGVLGYELPIGIWTGSEFPAFMYNYQMTRVNADNYAYSPMKSWPVDANKVRFFAYYPHSSSVASGAVTPSSVNQSGFPYVEVVLGKSNEPVDFLVAQRDAVAYNETTDGEVGFSFEHKLSKLVFKAKAAGFDPTLQKVFINQLMIKNVYNKAVFLFDGTTEIGKWDQKSTVDIDATSGATLHLPSSSTPVSMTSFEDILDPSGAEAYILMIPQTYSNVEFLIYYTIERADPNGGCLDHIITYKKIPVSAAWEPGKIYTYEIEFAFSEVEDNRVNLNFTVQPWAKKDISTEIN